MKTALSPKYCLFFKELKENNSKAWFEANKHRYEEIKQEFVVFMADFIERIQELEPLPSIDPKKSVFRIYRDVRFSKDKTPYKCHIASVIDRGKDWHSKCGFYIHIEPGNSFVGGGAWEPGKEALKAIRQEIDYNGTELLNILNNQAFKETFGTIGGEKLKTAPRDYATEHQHIELLKHKQFLFSRKFSDKEVVDTGFMDKLVDTYQKALPFFGYFDVVFKEIEEKVSL